MLSTGIAVGSFNASIDSLSFFFNHTYKVSASVIYLITNFINEIKD